MENLTKDDLDKIEEKTSEVGFKIELDEEKKQEMLDIINTFGPQSKELFTFLIQNINPADYDQKAIEGMKKIKRAEIPTHKVEFERGGVC